MKVCAEPNCPELTSSSRCPQHTRERDRARGTRKQRGYGNDHLAERRRWDALVRCGGTLCARCGQPIERGQPWHLDHTDDRLGWIGPSHKRCNLSAAGKASHR